MKKLLASVLTLLLFLPSCVVPKPSHTNSTTVDLGSIPAFEDFPYVVLSNNEPDFSDSQLVPEAFESYSELDYLGRCSVATACISKELMPTEDRGSIGQIKPSGWQTVKYDIVDGNYLYNRCHLIGFQLTGENANEKNLITGTRYMNVDGMLPFENIVADYIKETGNHVLYRVTPIFHGEELVARGVQMEARSIEDDGEGICFNVYVYNNQPGVTINYANGESALSGEPLPESGDQSDTEQNKASGGQEYILNTSSKKFHRPDCGGAEDIKEENKEEFKGDREELIDQGYSPCGNCDP